MSSLIFPVLPGQKFTTRKSPSYNNKRQKALSGKESAIAFRAYPLYSWELEYGFLSDDFSQAPARTNYVLYSQDVTQWGTTGTGVGFSPVRVANVSVAPDGTLTADRVILNIQSGTTSSDVSQITSQTATLTAGVIYTISFWAKTNDGSTVAVWPNGANLGGNVSIGPTWQRITKLWTPSQNATTFGMSLIGNVGTSKYADLSVWGFQVELGSSVTSYIQTNGSAVRQSDLKSLAGFVSQMLGSYDTFLYQDPDFNTVIHQQFGTGDGATAAFNLTAAYAPGASIDQFGSVLGPAGTPEWVQNTNGPPQIYTNRYGVPELLSSGSRTNLFLQSAAFDNASWATKTNVTVTANATTAPDGTTTADKIVETAVSGNHLVGQNLSLTAGQAYTFSVFVKAAERTQIELQVFNVSDNWQALVDLSTLSVVSSSGGGAAAGRFISIVIESVGSSGWYRVSLCGQACQTLSHTISVVLASGGSVSYLGVAGDGLYVWGAQFESGTRQTSYIPTTSGAVTISSDYSLTNLTTAGAVNTFQQVQFASAPANTVTLLWSGSFFYRCRFSEDSVDFSERVSQVWDAKSLTFESILL